MTTRAVSLRAKILVIVSIAVSVYAVIDHLIQRATISPSFEALERAQSERDVKRATQALEAEIEHLDQRCRDRSAWDDTYRFVATPTPDYIASNLGPTAFHDADVNLIYVCDLEGRVIWGDVRDLGTNAPLELHDFPREAFAPGHPLLASNTPKGSLAGLIVTEHGPLIVSSRPILKSSSEGPSRGTLIMGRFLDRELVARLAERTKLTLDTWSLSGAPLPPSEAAILDRVTASPTPVIDDVDESRSHVYQIFNDVNAAPALLVRATVARDVTAEGARSVRYSLISTVASGVLLLLVLITLLRIMVLDPIGRLTRHAVAVGQSDDTSARVGLARADEIGVLSREFDRMLEKLAASRAAQITTARAAGMSELATGILHNVGNVLNSLNLSVTLLRDRVQTSKTPKLAKLADMLDAQAADLAGFFASDPRSKHVAPYLKELARSLESEREASSGDLERVRQAVEHIRSLVQSQQSFAVGGDLLEAVSIGELVESAIELVRQGSQGVAVLQPSIEVEAGLPRVLVDRHKLTEILVNLMKNAEDALAAARIDSPEIVVAAARCEGERLRISVRDNGVGIAAEHLERVFNHGFTTKKHGHGFGLHAAANAAAEMHGKLSAASGGVGRGAEFTLELPYRAAPSAADFAAAA